MSKTQNDGFLSEFVIGGYPGELLDRYELVECLAHNQRCETLLVKDKRSGAYFVAKCYLDGTRLSEDNESELLCRLRHPGLPAFAARFQNGAMLCVVREYADGVPLDVWRSEKDRSLEEIVSVGLQLCDILSYLHAQDPPVIHRDLKPQNIVVGENGRVRLIDFGISRTYEEGAKADTVCFGTAEFAPPEQYGFAQTDGRADIFSLGVVLRYLLSGETDAKAAAGKIPDGRLRKIIGRCTAFSPDKRYASAAQVRRALLAAKSRARKKAAGVLGVALISAALLAAGFAAGRYTDFMKGVLDPAPAVAFREPLIERAVRESLGKDERDALTPEDLAGVTELYIWNDIVARGPEEYFALGAEWGASGGKDFGSITSLADAALLPNLRTLMLGNERIADISPLAGLRLLKEVNLDKNPVKDISALKGMRNLEFVGLNETWVSDLSPLAACPKLRRMVLDSVPCEDFSFLADMDGIEFLHFANIRPDKVLPWLQGKFVRQIRMGYVALPSFDGLKGVRGLQELFLDDVLMDSLSGIGGLSGLTQLRLTGMAAGDLSPLLSLPNLKRLELDEGLRAEAGAIAEKAPFDIVYR
jgi:hypothetical protein